jgi:hypothetical protein
MCELEPRSESLTRSLLEGMDGEGREWGKLNCLVPLPSFSGPHTGLYQVQRPKTVEATYTVLYRMIIKSLYSRKNTNFILILCMRMQLVDQDGVGYL